VAVPLLPLKSLQVDGDMFNQTPRMVSDFLDSAKTPVPLTAETTPKMK